MIVGVFIIRYLSRMYLYMCFHIPTKEEKEMEYSIYLGLCMAWKI